MSEKQVYNGMEKCPECGKTFYRQCSRKEWGYAYGERLTCSYHCMRAMAKRLEGKPVQQKLKGEEKEKRNERIMQRRKDGQTIQAIANEFDLSPLTVNTILKQMRQKAKDSEEDRAMAEEPKIEESAKEEKPQDAPDWMRQQLEQMTVRLNEEKAQTKLWFQRYQKEHALTAVLTALMLAWKNKSDLDTQTRDNERKIDKLESQYFDCLREVGYSAGQGADDQTDPAGD